MPPVVTASPIIDSQDFNVLTNAPSAAAEVMRNIPAALRIRSGLHDGGSWREVASQMAAHLSPPDEPGALPSKSISTLRISALGERGGVVHDLMGGGPGRELAQRVSAQALAIVSIADFHIDTFGWEPAERIATLRSLLASVTDGRIETMPTLQLVRTAEIGVDLNQVLRMTPGGTPFLDEFAALAAAVERQITDSPSLELCAEVGARVAALSVRSAALIEPKIPPHILTAAMHWGAHVGLADDASDMREDLANMVATCVSAADNPLAARAEASRRSEAHLAEALRLLPPEARPLFSTRGLTDSSLRPVD